MKKLIVILALLFPVLSVGQISRTGSCSTTSTQCSLSAVATGDLKLVMALRTTSTTIPVAPAGWTNIASGTFGSYGYRIVCAKASSASDVATGVWQYNTDLIAVSYSGTAVNSTADCATTGIGGKNSSSGSSTSLGFPAVTLNKTDNTSWVSAFGVSATTQCVPASLTAYATTTTSRLGGSNTNATVSSFSAASCSITNGAWGSYALEILKYVLKVPSPVLSLVSGMYLNGQTLTITESQGTATVKYCTNASSDCDPTSGTTYTAPITLTNAHICAIGTESGYENSSVVCGTYSVPEAGVPVTGIVDDRASYIDAHLTANGVAQLPLDPQYTAGKWVTARPMNTSGGGLNFWANTSRDGLNADQYASVVHNTSASGPDGACVRVATNGARTAYCLTDQNSAELAKYVNGAKTVIATGSVSPIGNVAIELRVMGTNPVQLQPLVNGATPAGMSATYSDSGADRITGGTCGFAQTGSLWESNQPSSFTCGNIGASDSTTAHIYTPTYPTYTDAPMSTSAWAMAWPWFQATISSSPAPNNPYWGRAFAPYQVSGSLYALGLSSVGSGTISYRGGEFGANQWQRYKVGIEPHDPRVNNWFSPLQHQTWVPGTDGGCAAAGTTTVCYDSVSIYPGVETFAYGIGLNGTDTCLSKPEYACTPFMHVTFVAPTSTDDAVLTGGGSFYTPRKGDELYVEFVSGVTRVACKGNAANVAAWQANHAYSLNDYIVDSNGNWQRVKVAGTSGGTQPSTSTWGKVWGVPAVAQGATTTDGSVTWEYMGHPCQTNDKFSWVAGLEHISLPAFANQKGVPALWLGGNSGAPVFYDWSAGTVTASTNACGLDANLCESVQGSPAWVIW